MHIPKTPGGIVGLLFKIFGITAMAAPAINVIQSSMQKGDFSSIGTDLVYAYTGYSIPGGNLNAGQTGAAIASVGGGFVLIQIGKLLARAVR